MKKFAAIVATAGLLIAGGAATASAETLHRSGANKVKITADTGKIPAGAQITKTRINVKKGKKTVARNKAFYKAKKGKYKVRSTVSYYFPGTKTYVPGVTTTTPATTKIARTDSVWLDKCEVTAREVVKDQTRYEYASAGTTPYYVVGDAWIRYSATCDGGFFGEDGTTHRVAGIPAAWESSRYVMAFNSDHPLAYLWEGEDMGSFTGDKAIDLLFDQDILNVGDWNDGVSGEHITQAPTYTVPGVTTTTPGHWITTPNSDVETVKSMRTVRVK